MSLCAVPSKYPTDFLGHYIYFYMIMSLYQYPYYQFPTTFRSQPEGLLVSGYSMCKHHHHHLNYLFEYMYVCV